METNTTHQETSAMTDKEVMELGKSLIWYFPESSDSIERVSFTNDGPNLDGDREIGYFKDCGNGTHVLCNERVDVTIKEVVNHPSVRALGLTHYHRRGFKYSVTVYMR